MKAHPKKIILSSGVELLHLKTSGSLSYVSAWFRAGSRFDPKNFSGLAHFLEHLYGNRTKAHPRENELQQEMAADGISFNAYTSLETAHFFCTQHAENTTKAITYLKEILEQTIFDTDQIKKERRTIINEESQNRANPESYLWRLRNRALWPESSLSNDFYGDEESLEKITQKDLKEFSEHFYTASNAVFFVASPDPTTEIAEKIEKILLPAGENIEIKKADKTTPRSTLVENREGASVVLSVAFRGPPASSSKRFASDLLVHALANSWISALSKRLRTSENLSYWPTGQTEHFGDTGYLSFEFSASAKNAKQAISSTLETIEDIRRNRIKKLTLSAIKASYIESLLESNQTLSDHAWWYCWQTLCEVETPLSIEDYTERIKKVSEADIFNLAHAVFTPENRSIVGIGPITEKEIAEALGY